MCLVLWRLREENYWSKIGLVDADPRAREVLYGVGGRYGSLFLTEAVFHLKNSTKETTSLVAWKTGARLGWLVLEAEENTRESIF